MVHREKFSTRWPKVQEIQNIPGNNCQRSNQGPTATNVNKLVILLRTVHSIENMVTQALQNMISSRKIMI